MELDPDCNEEILVLESSADSTHENGDIMMLEELYQQEKFIESLQQFTENELSNLNELNTAQADIELIHDFGNDFYNFSPDKAFSSTFFQESTNYESSLQIDDEELIDLILENEDMMLDQSFVDCGTIDYIDKLDDYEGTEIDELQEDPILTDYLATADSSSDPLHNPKIEFQARVSLERLPESIAKVKDTAEVTTDRKIQLNDRKKSVKLYCHKCKKFEIAKKRVSMPKNCQHCGNLLIYLCTKCNEKYFTTYSAMTLHRKICKTNKSTVADVPTSLVVYDCQNCKFRTLHKDSVARHLRKTRHRFDDVGGNLRVKVNQDVKYTRQFERDYTKAFKRFCKKCNQLVSSTSSTDDKLCKKCSTRLSYRCIKCGVTSNSHKSLTYHLKNKCLLKKYTCCKCNLVTTKWKFMQRHMKRHANRINCEYCAFETNRKSSLAQHLALEHNVGDTFRCTICNTYTTTVAARLDKHILRMHSAKNEKTFECAICRRYSTDNRDDLWKHIERRHCEK